MRSGQNRIPDFGKSGTNHSDTFLNIINFFDKRTTNVAAESFNAKAKAFRVRFGVITKSYPVDRKYPIMVNCLIPNKLTC